jgi:peptidyl-prolyl cis-trans isomerase C
VDEFEQQVWSLAEGICTYPVESRYGFHLVKVDQRVEGKPLEYTYVATQIRQYLHEQSTRRALSQYLQILGAEIGVRGVDFTSDGAHLLQ